MTQPLLATTASLLDEYDQHRRLVQHLFSNMGGLLPRNLAHPTEMRRVLDVACEAGAWVLEVAQAYPALQVIGIDTCERLLTSAKDHAQRAGLTNAHFFVQDWRTLDMQHIPSQPFDLINVAFIAPALLSMDYQAFLRQLLPFCHPGGMVRWTEMEFPLTSSPAFTRLTALTCRALQHAGQSFIPPFFHELHEIVTQWNLERGLATPPLERRQLGITPMMGSWFRRAGYQHIQHAPTAIEVSYGTQAHAYFVHEVACFGQQVKPFLLAQHVITDTDFARLLSHVQDELHQENFCGLCILLTVSATTAAQSQACHHATPSLKV